MELILTIVTAAWHTTKLQIDSQTSIKISSIARGRQSQASQIFKVIQMFVT